MSDSVQVLTDEVQRIEGVVADLDRRLRQFMSGDVDRIGRDSVSASYVALIVTGVRERVIENEAAGLLHELLRFRHFRRYYFEMDYDWRKIDYLVGVNASAMPLVGRDLARFREFLARLAGR